MCAKYKDFGRGFYLTSSLEQARNFAKLSTRKAIANATITAYMVGTFGEIGTDSADNMCISLLLPDRLKDQFCFRTKAAVDQIQFLESEKIWL